MTIALLNRSRTATGKPSLLALVARLKADAYPETVLYQDLDELEKALAADLLTGAGVGQAVPAAAPSSVPAQPAATWMPAQDAPAMLQTISTTQKSPIALAVAPGWQWAATGGTDGSIKIWDLANGGQVAGVGGTGAAVNALAWRADGRRLLSGSQDGNVYIWDAASWSEFVEQQSLGDRVAAVAWSSDGSVALAATVQGLVQDVTGSSANPRPLYVDSAGEVTALTITPDGARFITASADGTILVTDRESGREMARLQASVARISAIALSARGNTLITAGADGILRLWDLPAGRQTATYAGTTPLVSCAVSIDGSTIVAGDKNGNLLIFTAPAEQRYRQLPADPSNFAKGRNGQPIIALVNHLARATLTQTAANFRQPGTLVSAHYGIGENGQVEQYVQDSDTAWGAGRIDQAKTDLVPWLGTLPAGISPNQSTLQLEWEGNQSLASGAASTRQDPPEPRPGDSWQPTEAQYQAGLALIRELCSTHGIEPRRDTIIRHSDINSIGNSADCPGPGFPLNRLLSDLRTVTPQVRHVGRTDRPQGPDYPIQSPPTLSPAVFAAWLTQRKSPVRDERDALEYYLAALDTGVNPAVALSFFERESVSGTQTGPLPPEARNWGNLRTDSGGALGRAIDTVQTSIGPFRRYGSWMDSLLDWCEQATGQDYASLSLRDFVRRYTRATRDEEVDSYTNAIRALLQHWNTESGEFDVPLNRIGRWRDGVIPYMVAAGLDESRVRPALDDWQSNTPFRFVPADPAQDPDYVVFQTGIGCASMLGRTGGRQPLIVGLECSIGSIIHEIGHLVGLQHTIGRSDRDQYVEILWDNIVPTALHNFDKRPPGSDPGPFDYGSLMMFPSTAFSANGQPTIRTLNGQEIGQRQRLSTGDYAALQSLYPQLPWSPRDNVAQSGATHGA